MTAKKTYTRPSGTSITVNDTPATREYAQQNGWKASRKKAVKNDKRS